MPAVKRHLTAAEDGLLGGVLERGLIGLGGAVLPGQFARGVDIGEIGADGFAVAIDEAVRQRDPAGHGDRAKAEQHQAVAAHARGCQPFAR